MIARFCGSTNVPPPVATTSVAGGQLLHEHGALDRAEIRFAPLGEELGHRLALAPLDQLVDVHDLPSEPSGQRASDRGLTGAHETDQINLVDCHTTSRWSVSKKPG